ncbi:MAG: hypothetical protein ACFBWO_04280 [Paracoccaceae bacterium]
MSDTDSFIREVSEEVRQERFATLAKRYGPYVLGVVAVVVLAGVVASWLEAEAREAALETGGAFAQAQNAEPGQVETLLAGIEGEARILARMRLARAQAEAGDRAVAADTYRTVADDAGAQPRYADLARLEAARLDAATGRGDQARAALDELVLAGGAYAMLARELRAVLRLNAGDLPGARDDLDAVANDAGASRDTLARVRALAATLPGETPAAPEAEAAPGGETPVLAPAPAAPAMEETR